MPGTHLTYLKSFQRFLFTSAFRGIFLSGLSFLPLESQRKMSLCTRCFLCSDFPLPSGFKSRLSHFFKETFTEPNQLRGFQSSL